MFVNLSSHVTPTCVENSKEDIPSRGTLSKLLLLCRQQTSQIWSGYMMTSVTDHTNCLFELCIRAISKTKARIDRIGKMWKNGSYVYPFNQK